MYRGVLNKIKLPDSHVFSVDIQSKKRHVSVVELRLVKCKNNGGCVVCTFWRCGWSFVGIRRQLCRRAVRL